MRPSARVSHAEVTAGEEYLCLRVGFEGEMSNPWADDADGDVEPSAVASSSQGHFENRRENLLILIDCSGSMVQGIGAIGAANALFVSLEVLKSKIILCPRDKIGVVFFNCKNSLNQNNFAGVCELRTPGHSLLEVASADRISQVGNLLDSRKSPSFLEAYGSGSGTSTSSLHDALHLCSLAFSEAKPRIQDFKRVWVFTDNDNPCGSDVAPGGITVSRYMTRSQDMGDSGIELNLWYTKSPFALETFYRDLLLKNDEGLVEKNRRSSDPGIDTDDCSPLERVLRQRCINATSVDHILGEARRRGHVKRPLRHIEFKISDGYSLGMKAYALVRKARKPTPVFLDVRTNEELSRVQSFICATTGTRLQPDKQIHSYVHTGQTKHNKERVPFSKKDMLELKNVDSKCRLRLLGFKAESSVHVLHQILDPHFLYPDDSVYSGSFSALVALHSKMIERKVVAIVHAKFGESSLPRLAAMFAQAENIEDGFQDTPPGFMVVLLPYADEVREESEALKLRSQNAIERVKPEYVSAAGNVVANMAVDDDLATCVFYNPSLQKHYHCLQALALDESEVGWTEEDDDEIVSDRKGIEKHAGPHASTLLEMLPPIVSEATLKKKRKAEEASAKAEKKRRKALADIEGIEFEALFQVGKLKSLTVKKLQAFLITRGQQVPKGKTELVSAVESILQGETNHDDAKE